MSANYNRRPVKLCLSIEIQEGLSYADALAMTRVAEELGFDASLLAEHYYPSGPPERYTGTPAERMSADAWIYLAGMARETSRIRLGTLVSPVTFRHPAVLAKMAATLDHLSDGRAELGIGAGWLEAEHKAFGIPFPEPARRVDLVEEQLQVITGLWTESPFTHNGTNYQLDKAYFSPKPARTRIIVGGRTTSRRLLRLAARYGDEYVIGQPTPDDVRDVRARLDQACAANERDPKSVRLSVFVPICIAESAAAADRLMDTYKQTNPQYVGMMADTSRWLMGTPADVHAKLQSLEAGGVERVIVAVNSDVHREMLPLLARANHS